MQIAKLKT